MTVPSVERLARLAARYRPDGTQGWRARRAWRALTAVDVLMAAVDPGRSAESRAAIGMCCLRHDLVPDNDVDRALFFVLIGQHERYEALDPDGTLLAAAYRGASEATREALRHNMVGLGELNAVRVIADRPDRVLAGEEADYVAGQLAGAGEWERLRRLILTMPLPDAMRAARLCPAGGDPFFTRLAGTDPDTVAAVAAAAVTRLRTMNPNDFSIAPDNSEILVRTPESLRLYTLPGGQLVADVPARSHAMLALGDATFVYVHTALHAVSRGTESTSTSLYRCTVGRARETLLTDYEGDLRLGRTPGGFVVTSRGTAYVGTTHGPWTRTVPLGSAASLLAPDTVIPVPRPVWIPQEASWFSPDGSRAVVQESDGADVYDLRLRHLAEVATRPLSAATPADLKTVGALANLPPPAGELLSLLRAGLTYRFGADVALGDAMTVGRADDIALGGGG